MATSFRYVLIRPATHFNEAPFHDYFELTKLQIWNTAGVRLCAGATVSVKNPVYGKVLQGTLSDLVTAEGTGSIVRISKNTELLYDLGSVVTAEGINIRKSTGSNKSCTLGCVVIGVASDPGTGGWQEADARRFTIYQGPNTLEPAPTTTWWLRAPLETWNDSYSNYQGVSSLGTRRGAWFKRNNEAYGGSVVNTDKIISHSAQVTSGKWVFDIPPDIPLTTVADIPQTVEDWVSFRQRDITTGPGSGNYAGIRLFLNFGTAVTTSSTPSTAFSSTTLPTFLMKSDTVPRLLNPGKAFNDDGLTSAQVTPSPNSPFLMTNEEEELLKTITGTSGLSSCTARVYLDLDAKTLSFENLSKTFLGTRTVYTLGASWRAFQGFQFGWYTRNNYLPSESNVRYGTRMFFHGPGNYEINEAMASATMDADYNYGPGVNWNDIRQYFGQMIFAKAAIHLTASPTNEYGVGGSVISVDFIDGSPFKTFMNTTPATMRDVYGFKIPTRGSNYDRMAYVRVDAEGNWYDLYDRAVELIADKSLPAYTLSYPSKQNSFIGENDAIVNYSLTNLEGRTYDIEELTGEEIPTSAVVIATDLNNKNNTFRSVSNSDTGIFLFEYLPPGRYVLAAFILTSTGYRSCCVGMITKSS